MKFFFSGPRILGVRPGIIFGLNDINRVFRSPRNHNQIPASFIYVIEGEGGKHKIGISSDPIRRISELQTGSPVALKFSFIAVSSHPVIEIETLAHNLLTNYRTSGEWFCVPASVAIGAIFEGANKLGHSIQQVQTEMVPEVIRLSKKNALQSPWIDQHPFVFWFAIISLLWSALFAYIKT